MRKTLQELTLKDNFMFAAVMMDTANCKPLLEMVLKTKIHHIEVTREKSIVYNPEYKGIRLDVYADDKNGSHYNVEMQVRRQDLLKRSRYYHSQMDMEYLASNTDYSELPKSYVIFICDFDPFYLEKYRYTEVCHFREAPDYEVDHGQYNIYLSTKGKNSEEEPENLVKFLRFVESRLEESNDDFEDSFVKQLQESIKKIKQSREMGNRYMIFEEMLREEREEGREEGQKEGLINGRVDSLECVLQSKQMLDDELRNQIEDIKDDKLLIELIRYAATADTVREFKDAMKALLDKKV